MARNQNDEPKAAAGPAENKAAQLADDETAPKPYTTEGGRRRQEALTPAELSKEQDARQKELAASGYRIPQRWHTDAERRQERDDAIAKAMPSTRPEK